MTEQEKIWELAQKIRKTGPATPDVPRDNPDWWRTPRKYEGNNQDVIRRLAAIDSVPSGENEREEYFTKRRESKRVDEEAKKKSMTKKWNQNVENELEAFQEKLSERVY